MVSMWSNRSGFQILTLSESAFSGSAVFEAPIPTATGDSREGKISEASGGGISEGGVSGGLVLFLFRGPIGLFGRSESSEGPDDFRVWSLSHSSNLDLVVVIEISVKRSSP